MPFSIKYNVGQEEIENLSDQTTKPANMTDATTSIEDSPKSKRVDKSGSILDKYFKSFKSDKSAEEDSRTNPEAVKDSTEKKSLDVSNENSGSPIKEYFNKFSKRSDSIDTNSDIESIREHRDRDLSINSDKWKLFSEFKYKIAQAVEDIKSSRNVEATDSKEKLGNVDNSSVTDSEDNSLQQELEQISCTSTENQVSSLTNSTQNLSELSPPIISHSSTMTDMDMDMTNSSDTNQNLTETGERRREHDKMKSLNIKSIQYSHSDDDNDEHLEVESGVEALEDVELLTPKEALPYPQIENICEENKTTIQAIVKSPIDREPPKKYLMKTKIIVLSALAFVSFFMFPAMLLFNGCLLGIWLSNVLHECYLKIWNILENNDAPKKSLVLPNYQDISMSRISQIIEFEPLKKYQGWINVYTLGKYNPLSYHIAMTQTAFMKLEGSTLRLSFTHNKIQKRALWDEKPHKVPFYQHRIYNLDGAKIKLLPDGIVSKRYWSKKYPISIILKDASKLTVYNAKSHPVNETTKDNSKASKIEHSPSEPKDIIEVDQFAKFKGSPRKTAIASEEKLSKSLPIEILSNKQMFDDTLPSKPPNKSFLTKAGKEQRQSKNTDLSTSTSDDFGKNGTEFSDPPIIKERPGSSNSLYSDDQISESDFLDNFKEVSQQFDDDNDNQSESDKNVFNEEWSKDEIVECQEEQIILYLFGRTGREKDEWFRRLKSAILEAASVTKEIVDPSINLTSSKEDDQLDVTKNVEPYDTLHEEIKNAIVQKENIESKVKLGNVKSPKKAASETQSVLWTAGDNVKESPLINTFYPNREENFWRYMKDIIEIKTSPNAIVEDTSQTTYNVSWLNAITGRIIFDTFKNDIWVNMVQERIQKKLKSLKLPPFMSPLLITALKFAPEAPQIHNASAPHLDSQGVWVDLHISYEGRVTMTLTTQLNLMYLKEKRENQSEESSSHPNYTKSYDKDNSLAVYDSDLDDTAESSSEDETPLVHSSISKPIEAESPSPVPPNAGNSSAKKILRFVDKIAANKYFQHVTEYKYVKRALEEVSNTDLKLSVELYGLVGCLTINIPPPPSDRIWIGFRDNPQILLKAKPEVGSRAINFAHITSWIEKKLCREFEKVLVLPNMEDFQFDFMIAPVID